KITIRDVYPGIDWVFYNSQKTGMKYDFVVHAGADASKIKLWYEGDKPLKIEEDGSISIKTKLGTLTESKPYTYEENNNNEIESNYKLTAINKNKTLLEFNLANHNTNNTLVIDPQLNWGTFYGVNDSEIAFSLTTDASGNLFATGQVYSTNFPVLNPGAGAYFQIAIGGFWDTFILKFNNSGVHLWASYYGGAVNDLGWSIGCDATGNVFVTGQTNSTNFPLQFLTGAYNQGVNAGNSDVFILKFNNSGVRIWATYYGGSVDDVGYSLNCDNSGNVFVTGSTNSNNFPVLNPGAGAFFQGAIGGGPSWANDVFILKFNNNGVALWATYYGGSSFEDGFAISCDASGNVFVTGRTTSANFPVWNPGGGVYFQGINVSHDAYILKFSNSGVQLWATYYGGSSLDYGISIAIDNAGNVFVFGWTDSTNFPTLNPGGGAYFQGAFAGWFDASIIKFSNTGICLWSTYYGGPGSERSDFYDCIDTDACGNVYVCTMTGGSPNLPINASCGAFTDNYINQDIYVIKFTNSGRLLWATYVGGNGLDQYAAIALDTNNNLFLTINMQGIGINNSTYPLANPGGGSYYDPTYNSSSMAMHDAFFMKFTPIPPTYQKSQVNPTACSCTGAATISVTCGEAPYTYQWSNSMVQANVTNTTSSITGLCPGVYQVTVTSNCNYTYTTSYTLTGSASNLTVNATVQNANCTSPTGSVIINSVTNGVPNYTLAEASTTLAAGFNTPYTLTNVSVGTHTYVLTNSNGCSTTFTAQ
ncbi:MAG: SBBP repeat-containing protein, partial [Sphingobacteriaceae bacterium]